MDCIEIRGRSIDLTTGLVVQDGEEHYLAPRLLALLNYFVAHRGEVLSRDRIIVAVWGHLDAATDDSVNVAVSGLRRELGDTRRPHRVLQAIPRRGYRMVPESIATGPGSDTVPANRAAPTRQEPSARLRRSPAAAIALVLVVMVSGALLLHDDRGEGSELSTEVPAAVATPDRPSVVVLPFLDMSPAGDQQFFADGLVDRITHMLAQSPDLEVVARTSAFAFRGEDVSIRDVADRLGVDAVLEGSVQRHDDTVRVLAQMIETGSETHLWSRTYDRPLTDLFDVQDDIANLVSRTLTDTLLAESVMRHPVNDQAHELVTRGRFTLDEFTLDAATRARQLFERALELDPENIAALIGFIDAVGMQRSQGALRTADDVDDFTEDYLERAQRIDPDSPLVIRATGDWHFRNGRLDEAERSYLEAVRRNPNDAFSYASLGWVRFRRADYEPAIEALRTAVRLDPFSGLANVWLADAYWAVGRSEEALFRLRRIIRDRPDFPQAYGRMASYLAQTGATGEAMRFALRQQALDPSSPTRLFHVCESYLQIGDIETARDCTERLDREHALPLRTPLLRSIIAQFEGDHDARVAQLEAIYALGTREPSTKAMLAEAYARTDCSRALSVIEASFPELFVVDPEILPMNMAAAYTAAFCLKRSGKAGQARPIVSTLEEFLARTRVERGPWQVIGYERAVLAMLKDDPAGALAELEDLIEGGWRYSWWGLENLVVFESLHEHPRFRELLRQLHRSVDAQREHFLRHRDEPLT